MATKLKNLKVTKVDFVDQGANQRADVNLFKRKEDEAPEPAPEGETQMSLLKRFARWLKGDASEEEIEKAASSFNEQMLSASTEQIQDEIWNVTYALRNALGSILCDPEMDAASRLSSMGESLQQFDLAMKGYFTSWCAGQIAGIQKSVEPPSEAELAVMRSDHAGLEKLINKANSSEVTTEGEVEEMMKIDKSKMSPEERAAYDELIKKYAVEETEDVEKKAVPEAKADDEDELEDEEAEKKQATKKSLVLDPEMEALKKSLREEREELRKMREQAQDEKLMEVAKRYAVLGRKPEDLVKKFKALKAVSEDLYNDEIAALDEMVKTMSAGVFGEIGKSAEGSQGAKSAIAKARAKAAELKKNRPELTDAQALDAVLLEDPELMAELDK